MRRTGLFHRLGWVFATACLVLAIVGALAVPVGTGPEGVETAQGVFAYVESRPYSLRRLSPVARWYLHGGFSYLLVFALLVGGVAGQRRWSRFVAALPAGLGLAVLVVGAALNLRYRSSDGSPDSAAQHQLSGTVLAVLAGLVLVAIGFLLAGLRPVYDWIVIAGLAVLAVEHIVAVTLLHGFSDELRLNVLAWAPAVAYLLAAGGAALASIGRHAQAQASGPG